MKITIDVPESLDDQISQRAINEYRSYKQQILWLLQHALQIIESDYPGLILYNHRGHGFGKIRSLKLLGENSKNNSFIVDNSTVSLIENEGFCQHFYFATQVRLRKIILISSEKLLGGTRYKFRFLEPDPIDDE